MKLLSVCSARPNFVKLAAVQHAFVAANLPNASHVIVHTGQHYDPLFSDIFFTQLQIPQPKYNLGVKGGTREEVIERTKDAMIPTLQLEKPDVVLVYGDVNGAVGAARAAKQLGMKIAHIEAGLRSFDLEMPEEHNRMEIDRLADLLFITEKSAKVNIQAEKLKGEVCFVGNTMIDTLRRMMPIIDASSIPETGIDLSKPFAILTLHRPSNVDDPVTLKRISGFINDIGGHQPIVLPMHHRLKQAVEKLQEAIFHSDVHSIEPLGYIPFLRLCKSAACILTDSGGIQEEATLLGKRCFTLRRNTERPSTIESGSNVLIDPENPEDLAKVLAFAKHPTEVGVSIPPLWDGKAGERIIAALRTSLQHS